MILDAASRALLEFEQRWTETHSAGNRAGKDAAIRAELGYSEIRYEQLLSRLIDDAGASAAFPQLCSRLRRIRDQRATARARRMP